jgi:hypothetical protein
MGKWVGWKLCCRWYMVRLLGKMRTKLENYWRLRKHQNCWKIAYTVTSAPFQLRLMHGMGSVPRVLLPIWPSLVEWWYMALDRRRGSQQRGSVRLVPLINPSHTTIPWTNDTEANLPSSRGRRTMGNFQFVLTLCSKGAHAQIFNCTLRRLRLIDFC